MQRLSILAGHLLPSVSMSPGPLSTAHTSAKAGPSDDDVVIVYSKRTAIGKAKRGSFKDTTMDQMITPLFQDAVASLKFPVKDLGDIVVGNVLPLSGQAATEMRIAMLMAGIPKEVPVRMVNRQCSSGLDAIASVVSAIKAGYYDIGIGGGVESMSLNPMGAWNGKINDKIFSNELAAGCFMSMGVTSENVAERYGITREQQDAAAAESHTRALAAIKSGRFRDEILPVRTTVVDKAGDEKEVVVEQDEGPRPGSTPQKLAKLRAVFKEGGSTTAGNASQTSDGAAIAVLARRSYAKAHGLPILGRFVSYYVAGVEPAVMGIGPAVAIPGAVKKAGLSLSDIDLFEINEAFASQFVYCANKLGLDQAKINVNGGAIALGHPLGCTGARMMATLLSELKKRGQKYGVISMCIGSGMGAGAVVEAE